MGNQDSVVVVTGEQLNVVRINFNTLISLVEFSLRDKPHDLKRIKALITSSIEYLSTFKEHQSIGPIQRGCNHYTDPALQELLNDLRNLHASWIGRTGED